MLHKAYLQPEVQTSLLQGIQVFPLRRDYKSPTMTSSNNQYELYSYFRSSCSARVRIAAHHKGIPLTYKFIQLLKNDQQSPDYTALNPSKNVPTLIVRNPQTGSEFPIRQSIAILEYFEDQHPELPALLPPKSNAEARAKVRELVNVVACDIQPVTNLKVINKVKPLGVDPQMWQREWMSNGLEAFEAIVHLSAGLYAVGDEVTMADVVLAPAVDNAIRYGVDISRFPTIGRIYNRAQKLEAFQKGSWKTQPDTPEDLRQ